LTTGKDAEVRGGEVPKEGGKKKTWMHSTSRERENVCNGGREERHQGKGHEKVGAIGKSLWVVRRGGDSQKKFGRRKNRGSNPAARGDCYTGKDQNSDDEVRNP